MTISCCGKRKGSSVAADVENGGLDDAAKKAMAAGKEVAVAKKVARTSSPLQERLWRCLERGEIASFVLLLPECVDIDAPHGEDRETMLIIASQKGYHDAAKALLERGADPNIHCECGLSALHHAAFLGQYKCLELLLKNPRTDVAATTEEGGWDALFLTTFFSSWEIEDKDGNLKCIRLLLEHPKFEANRPNSSGITSIRMAIRRFWEERVRVILEAGRSKIDVDWQKPELGWPLRLIIQHKFPRLSPLLPPRRLEDPMSPNRYTQLMAMVQRKDAPAVAHMLEEEGDLDANHFYGDPYHCTLLHLVCRVKGYDEFIPLLLKHGADPNAPHPLSGDFPILLAAEAQNPKAVQHLLASGKLDITVVNNYKENAVHLVTQCIDPGQYQMQDMVKALELLLDYKAFQDYFKKQEDEEEQAETSKEQRIDVNARDQGGDTALHNAAYFGLEQALLLLLRRGGDLLLKNEAGEAVLDYVEQASLKAFLDEQVDSNGLSPQSSEFELIFKYDSIIPNLKNNPDAREMDPIILIKNNMDLRHLITHPLICTFLYLKWHNVKVYFMWNLLFYLLFVLCITAYSVIINVYSEENWNMTCVRPNLSETDGMPDMSHVNNAFADINNTFGEVNITFTNYTFTDLNASFIPDTSEILDTLNRTSCVKEFEMDVDTRCRVVALRCLIVFFVIFLVIREGAQLAIAKHRYFLSAENILELLLIIGTILSLFTPFLSDASHKHICGLLILLAWTELILMSGRLPSLSIQLEMFKKVTVTFIRFMAWYSLIILAFAFSFFVLFYGDAPFFLSPALAVVKTLIMLAGEFEAADIKFQNAPYTSHIIFLLFVLFVAIVLLNLLSGLAVYDTQAIKDDAKVFSLISMASLVFYIEDFLEKLIYISKKLRLRIVEEQLSRNLRLFNHDIPHRQIHVFKAHGSVKFLLDAETTKRFEKYKMSDNVTEKATDLVINRNQESELEKIKTTIADFSSKLDSMEEALKSIHAAVMRTLNN